MPIAKLIFKLPDEREEFEYAYYGMSYSVALDELAEWLRKVDKYEERDTIPVQEIRDKLHDLMREIKE